MHKFEFNFYVIFVSLAGIFFSTNSCFHYDFKRVSLSLLNSHIRKSSYSNPYRMQMIHSSIGNINSGNFTKPPSPPGFLVPFSTNDIEKNIDKFGDENSKGIIPIGGIENQSSQKDKGKYSAFDKGVQRQRSRETLRYFNLIDKLTPNDMIQKFSQSASKQVQEAVKSTIMSLFGSMPNYILDAALVTTNTKLANLLFQMQMTGYMFKNAEYRMSLTRSLKGLPRLPSQAAIQQGNISFYPSQENNIITGSVEVQTSQGDIMTLDVNELTTALSQEVQALRAELSLIRSDREVELRSNLLTYVQALPERDLEKLTSDMTPDVLETIKMLVDALMERLGVDNSGPDVIIEQSVQGLAQLCMWQLVIGYKLREYEALDRGSPLD